MRYIKYLFTVPEGETVTEKSFRRVLTASVCSILLCMSCLAGTTWAWFTTTLTNENEIHMGTVDIRITATGTQDPTVRENPDRLKKDIHTIEVVNKGNIPGYGEILLSKWGSPQHILRTEAVENDAETVFQFTLELGMETKLSILSTWHAEGIASELDEWKDIPVTVVEQGDTVVIGATGYTVTYVSGIEGVEDVPQKVGLSETYTFPSCMFEAPEGKTFAGWQLDETVYQENDTYTLTEDITVTAVWQDSEESTDPTESSKPTEPAETTQPTEPEETVKPTEPEETVKPTEPEETVKPTEPEETVKPTEPAETTQPTEPAETTQPTETEATTEPTKPEETTQLADGAAKTSEEEEQSEQTA